jgi:hypothetical protein
VILADGETIEQLANGAQDALPERFKALKGEGSKRLEGGTPLLRYPLVEGGPLPP